MTDKLPPLPDLLEKAIAHFAQACLYSDVNARRASAEQLKGQIQDYARQAVREAESQRATPTISTEHGPWKPSTHPREEGEQYCTRCMLRDKFLGSRACTPHIVYQPNNDNNDPEN